MLLAARDGAVAWPPVDGPGRDDPSVVACVIGSVGIRADDRGDARTCLGHSLEEDLEVVGWARPASSQPETSSDAAADSTGIGPAEPVFR